MPPSRWRACLGFLPYNWPRARVFLGDTGSMFIGFLLAALSVMGVYTRGAHIPVLAVLTPVFVLAIPVLDAVLVVVLRVRDGQPPWVGDRRHISHRLVRRGMRPSTAVAALWAAGAACGFAALLLPTVGPTEAPLLLALLLCAWGRWPRPPEHRGSHSAAPSLPVALKFACSVAGFGDTASRSAGWARGPSSKVKSSKWLVVVFAPRKERAPTAGERRRAPAATARAAPALSGGLR